MIAQKYIKDSNGTLNLFFRPVGTEVFHRDGLEYVTETSYFVVQWGGDVDYDSGYTERHFTTEAEAREFFENY